MEIALPLGLFSYFLISGMPIAFALAVCGSIGLFLVFGLDATLSVLQTTPYRSTANYVLAAIPMFVLMAEFIAASRFSETIFRCAHAFTGRIKGSLATATVLSGAVLGALSGSSLAATALMARISIPEMRRFGYSEKLALGSVAMAGTLAVMIPPSIPLVLYGVITETSIGKLLIAGIVPGLLTALAYCVVCYCWARREFTPNSTEMEIIGTQERWNLVRQIWPIGILMFLVLGGLYSGITTATEAAAVGALGALLIGLLMRRLSLSSIREALEQTSKTSAMLFIIVVGTMIFGTYLAATQVTDRIVTFAADSELAGVVVISVIIILYLVLGCFLDQIAVLFLTLPITFPIVIALGYDPIWFGIIMTKTVEIGLVTPPLGMNAFVTAASANAKVEDTFKGVIPFLAAEIIILIILVVFPGIVMWVPDRMSG